MSRATGAIHARSLETSAKLKAVDEFLADFRPHSTLEIALKAQVCAVNSYVSELRANGRKIHCSQKGKKFYYRRVC